MKELEVYGDSTLVIYQLRGEWETRELRLILYHKYITNIIKQFNEWKTRELRLILYHKYITNIIKQFNEINFNHLPREENQMANALVTLAAMFQVNSSDEV